MIRFLIDTTSSKTDVNGNRYHFATIISTKTQNVLQIKSLGGPSNARALVRDVAEWDEIHSTQAEDIPIRQFNRLAKFHEKGAKYEHEITSADVEALEDDNGS